MQRRGNLEDAPRAAAEAGGVRRRADTVAKELVKMGVNPDNIITEAKGGVDNLSPFSYNRRATVKIQ